MYNRVLKLKNVFYYPNINRIGGVETYLFEMGLKYGKDYDLTLLTNNGDMQMLRRIAQNMRVITVRPDDEIECDVFMFGFSHEILPNVKAKEYYQFFHGDFVALNYPVQNLDVTKRFGVSANTARTIQEKHPFTEGMEVMYNPYTPKKPRKVLRLVSATRLTPEKGFSRMVKLAETLDEADIPFVWLVFTDTAIDMPHKNMVKLPARYDVLDFVADADYLVQLSNSEGYSYSIMEALSVGTPVICTAFGVAEEQGVANGKTGFILPMDMSDIPVEQIYKGLKKFKFTPPVTHYEDLFVKGQSEYAETHKGKVTVRVKQKYMDLELNALQPAGKMLLLRPERAEQLEGLGLVEMW